MHLNILAFDFDGTLAEDGRIAEATYQKLEQARSAGFRLFLVTGRILSNMVMDSRMNELFESIIAEDGAVVYFPQRDRTSLPFGHLTPDILKRLSLLGIPLEHGLAIVASHVPYDLPIAEVLRDVGGGAALEYNRGAVMVMPPGATKGTGLQYALSELGYSPRNVLACGDAENDVSLFEIAELAFAVANAPDALKELADAALLETDGAGIRQLISGLLAKSIPRHKTRSEKLLHLGKSPEGTPFTLDPFVLLEHNLGIIGDTRTGKSWFAGLLAEEMLKQGYQLFIIDPEGDYREFKAFPHLLLLGTEARLPSVEDVVAICEHANLSLVLDLSHFDPNQHQPYVLDLLHALTALRERRGRPHWFLFDEIQNFCSSAESDLTKTLLTAMQEGGFTLVSYRPTLVAPTLLKKIDNWLMTHLKSEGEVKAVAPFLSNCLDTQTELKQQLATLERGEGLLALTSCCHKKDLQRFSSQRHARSVGHIRHLHKYLLVPLPSNKRFYFHDNTGKYLGITAASLWEFGKTLQIVPLASLEYHFLRSDFEKWLSNILHEDTLAQRFRKIAHRKLQGEDLRHALIYTVNERYEELEALI